MGLPINFRAAAAQTTETAASGGVTAPGGVVDEGFATLPLGVIETPEDADSFAFTAGDANTDDLAIEDVEVGVAAPIARRAPAEGDGLAIEDVEVGVADAPGDFLF